MAKNLFGVPFSSGTYQDSLSREESAALVDLSMKASNPAPQPSDDYNNRTYSFSLRLPKSWEGKYDVVDQKTDAGHNIQFVNQST